MQDQTDAFAKEVWRIIDGYRNEGLSYAHIVGVLDILKAQLIEEFFYTEDEEGN
jgi:hypothetical protein